MDHANLNATEVARGVGVAAPIITRFLAGRRSLSLDTAIKIEKWSKGAVTARDLHRESEA